MPCGQNNRFLWRWYRKTLPFPTGVAYMLFRLRPGRDAFPSLAWPTTNCHSVTTSSFLFPFLQRARVTMATESRDLGCPCPDPVTVYFKKIYSRGGRGGLCPPGGVRGALPPFYGPQPVPFPFRRYDRILSCPVKCTLFNNLLQVGDLWKDLESVLCTFYLIHIFQ